MEHTGNVLAQRGNLSVIDCKMCGWAHLDPLPDAKTVEQYYRNDYYGNSSSWWRKELYEHTRGLWNTSYSFQASLLGSGRVVDWGCGAGFFAKWWRDRPLTSRSYGIEPNDLARSYLGYSFLFPDVTYVSSVTSNHRASLVFEHIVEPRIILAQMKQFLLQKILIIAPHDGPTNPLQVKLGGDWWLDKNHINYFSPKGLSNLAEGMGLRVTYRGATFPIELLALATGKDYRNDSVWGAKCHMFRLNFEKTLGTMAFRLYSTLHKKLGWGRELMYVLEEENCVY